MLSLFGRVASPLPKQSRADGAVPHHAQLLGDVLERLVDVVGEEEGVDVVLLDRARLGERRPVDDPLPVGLAEEHDGLRAAPQGWHGGKTR